MDLYFRQLRAGRDFGQSDPFASQMANFVYLIGDRDTRECVAVDPAWDLNGILDAIARDGMRLTGALVTHYHPDHIGGSMGLRIQGLAELMTRAPIKVYAQREEVAGVCQVSGLSRTDLAPVESGQILKVGNVEIRFIHTAGHTPGSQCFLVNADRLVSGDTLFIGACGRVDLPGGNPKDMYESLTQKLAKLPDDVELFPGHDYGTRPSAPMGDEKRTNPYLNARSLDDWLRRRVG
jgi:glyoxylase-like metal-dependent hydrolase (beta-lactamase superfamily II)